MAFVLFPFTASERFFNLIMNRLAIHSIKRDGGATQVCASSLYPFKRSLQMLYTPAYTSGQVKQMKQNQEKLWATKIP